MIIIGAVFSIFLTIKKYQITYSFIFVQKYQQTSCSKYSEKYLIFDCIQVGRGIR